MWGRRLQRAGQEADRIFRQYDAVEPENRLVARSLEGRYEAALSESRRLSDEYERFRASAPKRLSKAEWDRIRTAVRALMIEQVVVTQRGTSERLDVEIHWHGGQVTARRLRAPVRRLEKLSSCEELRQRVLELEKEGRTQQEIADRLNTEGWRPPRRAQFSAGSVSNLLRKCRPPAARVSPHPWRPPSDRKPNEWTVCEFAALLGMPAPTAYNWAATGVVSARRSDGGARWLIFADEAEVKRLQERRKAAARRTEAREKAWDQVAGTRS